MPTNLTSFKSNLLFFCLIANKEYTFSKANNKYVSLLISLTKISKEIPSTYGKI